MIFHPITNPPLHARTHAGISGLTLSGGGGFLSRMHGFSIDNLLALEAVLPDGKQIHATKDNEYADFIAVCKGGGGNFGIVTK